MTGPRFILTLSCPDTRGIVAAVAGFLAEQDGFILESAQFGDASTHRFFMRVEFTPGPATPSPEAWRQRFQAAVGARFSMDWQLTDASQNARVVLMVSRIGHCLNDLLYRYRTGQLRIDIPAVISNAEDFREIVEWHGIPFHCAPMDHGKAAQEKRVLDWVHHYQADTVVLARYMQILSPAMCDALAGRVINIHHSFLPSFKGARPYFQAYDKGVKLIGATAHYVTTDLDEGPIIEQEVARVDHSHAPDDLTAIGRDIECLVLARALRYHIERRVLLNGHKTVVFR